ncbi:hypothetical protein M378DRAFT_159967 [Amanita muscaria Koide BX008]|uniref:Uncharacterized protein n=1 Tax=Amanita muscaria (strain Koide BX008) TaxID=946122 RepID=A0A0C2WYY8_AMAMK|nr:hypothetical protein M378DRAFT_159967 [Amanita muscaria Koide BX008]
MKAAVLNAFRSSFRLLKSQLATAAPAAPTAPKAAKGLYSLPFQQRNSTKLTTFLLAVGAARTEAFLRPADADGVDAPWS